MKFPRAQKIIKGQNYLVYMDEDENLVQIAA